MKCNFCQTQELDVVLWRWRVNVISDCSYWVTPRPAALTLALVTGDYLYSVLISHLLSWGTKTKSYICTRTLGFIASCVTTHRYVTLVKLLPEAGKCDHGPRFYILHTRYTTHCAPAVICSLQEPENNRVSTRWHDDLITGTWIEAPWHRDFTDAAGKLFLCLSYVQCHLVQFPSLSRSGPPANLMSIEMSSQPRCDSLQILHNYPGQWPSVPGYHTGHRW